MDNTASGAYLFNVGLRHIYSVSSFSERNKANILGFTLMSKKIFAKDVANEERNLF